MVRMSQACIHLDFSSSLSPNVSLDFRYKSHPRKGLDGQLRMMSAAFSVRGRYMVQSTINSQCGRLQSARSHAISSTFQAQFSSAFDVVSLSTQVRGVMSVYTAGYRGPRWIRWDRPGCPRVWDHRTAAEVICSAASGLIVNGRTRHRNAIFLQNPAFPPTVDEDALETQVLCSLLSWTELSSFECYIYLWKSEEQMLANNWCCKACLSRFPQKTDSSCSPLTRLKLWWRLPINLLSH